MFGRHQHRAVSYALPIVTGQHQVDAVLDFAYWVAQRRRRQPFVAAAFETRIPDGFRLESVFERSFATQKRGYLKVQSRSGKNLRIGVRESERL